MNNPRNHRSLALLAAAALFSAGFAGTAIGETVHANSVNGGVEKEFALKVGEIREITYWLENPQANSPCTASAGAPVHIRLGVGGQGQELQAPTTVAILIPQAAKVGERTFKFTTCSTGASATGTVAIQYEGILVGGQETINAQCVANCGSGQDKVQTSNAHVQIKGVSASDSTPPVVTSTVTGVLGNEGWYVSDVTVSFTVSDPESAVSAQGAGCAGGVVTADTVGTTFSCSATSSGGTSTPVEVTVKRDATAPTMAFVSAVPVANAAGWNTGDVVLTWSCEDALSGAVSPTATATVGGEGASLLGSGSCADVAGNTAGMDRGVKIDRTAPTIAFVGAMPAANAAGWNTGDVVLSWSCEDALSGAVSPTATATVGGEGTDLGASGSCSDVAGNTAGAEHGGIRIDRTAPTIAAAAALQVFDANVLGGRSATHFAMGSASDALSGLASYTCDKEPGAYFALGTTKVTCTATDVAGNTAVQVYDVLVRYNFGGWQPPVSNNPQVKKGNTLPLKFTFAGDSVAVAEKHQFCLRIFEVGGGEVGITSTSNADSGTCMRPSDGQYIYNLATGAYKVNANYEVHLSIPGITVPLANFSVK